MASKKAAPKRPHWTEAPEAMQGRIRTSLYSPEFMRQGVAMAQRNGYRVEVDDIPQTYAKQLAQLTGHAASNFKTQHSIELRAERQAVAAVEAMHAAGLFDRTIEEIQNEKRTAAELEQAKRDAFIAERTTAAYERLAAQERARIERLAASEYDAAHGRAGR